METEYFEAESNYSSKGFDRYGGELLITGSPVDGSVTLNINDSVFDFTDIEQVVQFCTTLIDMYKLANSKTPLTTS